ncbi:hypothetical protein Rhopal_003686-T1 [Rhodotorula paludigena]|uniref:PLD phosphodiesterase domain-containing protein n=1 Tax=Rhodotorula paludigena TaxID=86838 RepID=A0AAV5GL98_9BASI|nr:hypothetical protein Rhopal_003686-T1 [Rhodotorula paludigena]
MADAGQAAPAAPPAPPAPGPPRATPTRKESAPAQLVALAKPPPFPPLELMHDRTHTVTHALAESVRAASSHKSKNTASSSSASTTRDRRWKAGLKPGQAAKKLFPKPNFFQRAHRRFFIKRDLKYGREWKAEELEEAAKRGNFASRPSDLFLKMYSDVLTCLTRDPLAGNVSPALIGTQGTIPLSIVSTIPDIMQHYKDCIVLAEKEVFLVTNYWQYDSVNTVASGLRELDKLVGERKGDKIVVKVMWDRGAIEQLWHNHVTVEPKTWALLGLPHPDEVPNLSIQVINFHRPLLGTFHQKAMVVDRKVALLNSNNIQDRPNLEMMVHLEGPIVDSLYDNMLISWDEGLAPALPCLTAPSPSSDPSLFPYTFTDSNPYLANIDVAKAAKAARKLLNRQDEQAEHGEQTHSLSPPDWWRRDSAVPGAGGGGHASPWHFGGHQHHHAQAAGSPGAVPQHGEGAGADGHGHPYGGAGTGRFAALVTQLVDKAREEKARLAMGLSSVMDGGGNTQAQEAGTTAAAGARTGVNGSVGEPVVGGGDSGVDSGIDTGSKRSGDEATLSNGKANGTEGTPRTANESLAVQTHDLHPASSARSDPQPPGLVDPSAPEPTGLATERDIPPGVGGDAKEPPPSSPASPGGTKGTSSSARLAALSKALNAGALAKVDAAIDDEKLIHDFKPHMLHRRHEPFPIALVNRRPHGSPGHNDIRCPQAAAWLAALKYAEKNVFIQTPTLNAAPIVRGVVEACSRGGKAGQGIPVTLFLDLGFNDKGESIPFQGGTNEEVVFRLYGQLRKLGKEDNLHVYWYTGKDQIRPLNAVHKSRNCHIKFMSVDGQCAIVGNGNLDSQSFWHSQEANILIDNPQIVADWMDQLRTNQSTHKYGRVDTDGIWRDPSTGEELEKPKSIGCFTALRAVI